MGKKRLKKITALFTKMHGAKIKREGQNCFGMEQVSIKIKKHIGIHNEGFNENKDSKWQGGCMSFRPFNIIT